MSSDTPKQFMTVAGKPIIVHTIERFLSYDSDISIVIALPEAHLNYWEEIVTSLTHPIQTVKGGKTRFHSVKNALDVVENSVDLVAVHDAVRPLVNVETITKAFENALKHKAAVPTMLPSASLRVVTKEGSKAVNRSDYREVQTPQVFNANILRGSYKQPYQDWMTDDASVVEAKGHTICTFEGNRENIKITYPHELLVAETLLKKS